MPNYNYKCSACEHTFDHYSKIADRNIPKENPCPNCGAEGTCEQYYTKMTVGDPIAIGVQKLPKDFKEGVLGKVQRVPGVKKRESKFD